MRTYQLRLGSQWDLVVGVEMEDSCSRLLLKSELFKGAPVGSLVSLTLSLNLGVLCGALGLLSQLKDGNKGHHDVYPIRPVFRALVIQRKVVTITECRHLEL